MCTKHAHIKKTFPKTPFFNSRNGNTSSPPCVILSLRALLRGAVEDILFPPQFPLLTMENENQTRSTLVHNQFTYIMKYPHASYTSIESSIFMCFLLESNAPIHSIPYNKQEVLSYKANFFRNMLCAV